VILGGGVSGLAAAHELLRRKVEVVIVDKADTIGTTLAEAVLEEGSDAEVAEGFVKAVTEAPGVTLLTGGRLSAVERTDGSLKVTVAAGGSTRTIEAGALLVATGSARYAPEEYPYGRNQAVISQQEFRALSAGGQAPWERVVMIQCVGARDEEHPYCSRFCCRQAISNALLHKANKPDCKVTIVHKGIRVFGFEEEILTQAVEQGVEFVSVAGKPEIEAGKVLRVKGRGQRGEIVSIDCDAVVLSLAHAADGDMHDLARTLGVELDRFGTFITRGSLSEPFAVEGADGAFVCGFARGPVVVEEAFDEGLAAAAGICRYLST
jgi:heterodisulfide reductase subunit A